MLPNHTDLYGKDGGIMAGDFIVIGLESRREGDCPGVTTLEYQFTMLHVPSATLSVCV